MMDHVGTVQSTPAGYLGICQTCGDRNSKFTSQHEAQAWCDEHEQDARALRLNIGAKRPNIRTVERLYREKSQSKVYTPQERIQWRALAEELRIQIEAQNKGGELEGQLELFATGEDTD